MNKWLFILLLAASPCYGQAIPHLAHSHVNGTVAPNTTVYAVMGQTVITEFPVEAYAQVPFYSSGTFSGMYVRLEDNSILGASTFTIRINGVSGTSKVVLETGIKTGTDSVHTDHINYGDKVDIQIETGAGGTTINPVAIYFLFTPDDGSKYQRFSPGSPNAGQSNTNGYQPYYSNITGVGGLNFYKENTFHVMRTSGTFRNLAVYVSTNARFENNTFSLWKNGVDTALSVIVPSSTTGLMQNTTTQVNFVYGDTVTFEIGMNQPAVGGPDGNEINFSFISMEVINTGTDIEYAVGTDGKPQNAGESWTIPFIAALTYGGDEYQLPAYVGGTLRSFCVYTGQNNVSTISTVKFRKNSVTDASMSVNIPANSTGTFCDNTNSITFVSTDTLAYITNSPAGTGTLYYGSVMAAFTPTASTTTVTRSPSEALPVGYKMFPSNNVWYTDISQAVVSSSNSLWVDIINGHSGHDMHADFGYRLSDGSYNGIPYNVVYSTSDPLQVVLLTTYATESDTQPAAGIPIPTDVIVEQDSGTTKVTLSGDQHMILIDRSTDRVYEMFGATRTAIGGNTFTAKQFTTWFSTSNVLREDGITSADAGGLPLLVGLIRWDEIEAGVINHAIRFTLELTHGPHIWPARHDADSGGALNPPFGMRVRMKPDVDISFASATSQIIFTAMKKYGMIMADNGGDWYISGAPNSNWDSDNLHNDFITVGIPDDIFEVVDEHLWAVDPATSAEARSPDTPHSVIRGNAKGRGNVKFK